MVKHFNIVFDSERHKQREMTTKKNSVNDTYCDIVLFTHYSFIQFTHYITPDKRQR